MQSGFRAPERVVRAQTGLHEHAVWADLPEDLSLVGLSRFVWLHSL